MIFMRAFCAVSISLAATPDSLSRLPNISIPTSGAADGTSSETMIVTAIGKMIFSVLETVRSCSILTARSFFEVSAFMIGG